MNGLSSHQLAILRLIADGYTCAEIATRLVITPKGATSAIRRLRAKLGARSAAHAVLIACQAGILDGRPRRHGDHAGYEAHRRRGEAICDLCREGERAHRRAVAASVQRNQEAA
ncbi:response regulator transcription factor [Streptomyces sp. NPDC058664]|uniref:response regulator transcription factor n=1 Tax=unclassified Streptomyces TaxID=2593676 RepID=UPI0036461206